MVRAIRERYLIGAIMRYLKRTLAAVVVASLSVGKGFRERGWIFQGRVEPYITGPPSLAPQSHLAFNLTGVC